MLSYNSCWGCCYEQDKQLSVPMELQPLEEDRYASSPEQSVACSPKGWCKNQELGIVAVYGILWQGLGVLEYL